MGFLRRPQNLKKSSSYFWQEHHVLCAQQRTCQKVDEDFSKQMWTSRIIQTFFKKCLCFYYWDYLTNICRNNWWSMNDVVENLGCRKVCIIRLDHICFENSSSTFWRVLKYAVARTEHDALVKSMTKIFSNFVAFSENPNFNKSPLD